MKEWDYTLVRQTDDIRLNRLKLPSNPEINITTGNVKQVTGSEDYNTALSYRDGLV